MTIVIWGLGEYYKRYKWLIEQNDVIAITDGNKNMWGNYVDGKMIIAPQEILNLQWDYVYITSTAVKPIYNSLLSMGVSKEKIRCYYDFIDIGHRVKKSYYNFQNYSADKETITLISQDLGVNGACRCLLLAANVYLNNGYNVILASPVDGVMRDEFLKIGCILIIDQNLMISNLGKCKWLANSMFVIINTLQMFYLLNNRNVNIPIIWWLHEPPYFYKCVCNERLKDIDYENLYVMPVSTVAEKAFSDVVENIPIEQLIYGIYDEYERFAKKQEHNVEVPIKFVTVGAVCEIKGIKFLTEVITKLPSDILKQCEFFIVGDDTSIYAEQTKEFCQANNLPVHFVGLCNHNQTMEMLSISDVFLCSSRIESMSIAVEEAMMMKKAVIVPDSAGNAQFVYEEDDGWVYKALDYEDLRKTIEDCVHKRKDLCTMGENGRKVFLRTFEYSIFERRMLALVNHILED